MNIEKEIELLKDWCNGPLISNLFLRYDGLIRDTQYYNSSGKIATYALIFYANYNKNLDKNHGWGKLKRIDKEFKDIQIRYWYDSPWITFEQYKKQII